MDERTEGQTPERDDNSSSSLRLDELKPEVRVSKILVLRVDITAFDTAPLYK